MIQDDSARCRRWAAVAWVASSLLLLCLLLANNIIEPMPPEGYSAAVLSGELDAVMRGRGAGLPWGEGPQRVALVTFASMNSSLANEMSIMINSLYSHTHGYDFHVERSPPDSERLMYGSSEKLRSMHSKPLVVLRHLMHYDAVLFVDSDSYVHDFGTSVEKFMESNMLANASLLLAQDCLYHVLEGTGCWTGQMNTGVFFVRNTPEAFRLLLEWASGPAPGGLCSPEGNDQECFNSLAAQVPFFREGIQFLTPGEYGFNERTASRFTINSHAGSFITHYVSCYGGCREEKLYHALRLAMHKHMDIDMVPSRPDRHHCGYVREFSFFLEELERNTAIMALVKVDEEKEDISYGEEAVINARDATEVLRSLLGCGVEAGVEADPG